MGYLDQRDDHNDATYLNDKKSQDYTDYKEVLNIPLRYLNTLLPDYKQLQ